MRLIDAIKAKPLHLILSAAIIFTFPIALGLITPDGVQGWWVTLTASYYNMVSSITLSLVFGAFVSLFVYNRSLPSCCSLTIYNSGKAGFAGGIGGALLGKCPACFSVIALVLPAFGIGSSLGITLFLANWAWAFMLAAIFLMIFSIYKLQGFKN